MTTSDFPSNDNELEQRAKEYPETLFHIHVGQSALAKVKGKLKIMDLDAIEMNAARGMQLAIALDDYAEMHHIGRLVSVPSRHDLKLALSKGEAFWRGFQIARGNVILKNGFRSTVSSEERFQTWNYAKSIHYDCAMEGFAFGLSTKVEDEIMTYNDMLRDNELGRSEPSIYLESIACLVSAIERSDYDYFASS